MTRETERLYIINALQEVDLPKFCFGSGGAGLLNKGPTANFFEIF